MNEKDICKTYDLLHGEQATISDYWQTLHDYFCVEAEDITKAYTMGTPLDFTLLWDSMSLNLADVFASGVTNFLIPSTSKWANLTTKNPYGMESKEVRVFMAELTEELLYVYNHSNFYDQMTPSFKGSGVYGTSILLQEKDVKETIRVYNLPIHQVCFTEDSRGRPYEYYICFEYTAVQAIDRFGYSVCSEEIQKEYMSNERRTEKKHKFIYFVGYRHERDASKMDNHNFPIEAKWVDYRTFKLMQEGGYESMPLVAHRFYKRVGFPWGFSPAMKALPDVRYLQGMYKTYLRATMKQSDPALMLPYDAFIKPLNLNNRAINYYNRNNMSVQDVATIGNDGRPEINEKVIEWKAQSAKDMMFYDAFLAFNGITKQLSVAEVSHIANEQMTRLGPAVGRWLNDVFNNFIPRTIDIIKETGNFPKMPDELMEDDSYEIEFTSPLALAQKQSSLQSMQTAMGMAGNLAQFKPEVLQKLDGDDMLDNIWKITNAPPSNLFNNREVAQVRQAEVDAQEAREAQATMESSVNMAETASRADKNFREATAIA